MYVRNRKERFRYVDVALLDIICLNLAFLAACLLFRERLDPDRSLYRETLIIICFADLVVVNLFSSYDNIERRGYYKEFVALVKQTIGVFLSGIFYLFSVESANGFSRAAFGTMVCVFFVLDYCVRLVYKKVKANNINVTDQRALLIITESVNAKAALNAVIENTGFIYNIKGFVLTDSETECDSIGGYPVVCSIKYAADYVCQNWVDDVLIVSRNIHSVSNDILKTLSETGVVIHIGLQKAGDLLGQKQFIESYGDYTVITSCMNQASALEIFLKRAMDFIGGLFGCIITAMIWLIIAPIIKAQSPGPVFFRQKRVGKNGKVFTMYKFRSMYLDAEEQKKDVASSNRVNDGMMFKIDFDPRIIGNVQQPDGTRKRGIGDFIRRTSIDEFPQFFNVLRGDMSLVGTRPPTLDEWVKYDLHHRARLAIKPGITGLWQVSGRSKITDFEEVVALDTKYINEWSLGLDIKILLKTVGVVLKREGAQ